MSKSMVSHGKDPNLWPRVSSAAAHKAALHVCGKAEDVQDAKLLLEVLGLIRPLVDE